MNFKLGLTGSIGMGKSTTAAMFEELGCKIWCADASVARLYAAGGAASIAFSKRIPDAVKDGKVDRAVLKAKIENKPAFLSEIEAIVHPLVAQDRKRFIEQNKKGILVFDIPLLFENGTENLMDAVACVFVSQKIQRERVLARGTMTEAEFEHILSRQMKIEEKCARSDYVIETFTLEDTRNCVKKVFLDINQRMNNA